MINDESSAVRAAQASAYWLPEIRWVLAALSPMVAIFVAIVSLVAGPTWLIRLCPPEDLISGVCMATWYRSAETVVISLGFGVAAALFVLLPTALAPRGKRPVAIAAFLCGLVLIASVGIGFAPIPALVAVLSGALAVVVIHRLRPSAA
jgi:peptidoglycan/LPS O-acetylase OafA/YrhL